MTNRYLYLGIIFIVLIGSLIVSSAVKATETLYLYINTSEGGDISNRNIARLKKHLHLNQCKVEIVIGDTDFAIKQSASFIFSPLDREFPEDYSILVDIKVFNDEVLSSSLLVRNSTGIDNIKSLEGVRLALLTTKSITGYQLPLSLLNQTGISPEPDKVTLVQSNISAISLLLHKDVFAAAIATPLAKKWAKANDLRLVATSDSVSPGSLMVNDKVSSEIKKRCLDAFKVLAIDNSKYKRVMKVFPAWVAGFSVVGD